MHEDLPPLRESNPSPLGFSEKPEQSLVEKNLGRIGARVKAVLLVSILASPLQAQPTTELGPEHRATITSIDPEAQIVDGVVIVASSAEAACGLLNTGEGFYIADADADPRILLLGGVGGNEPAVAESEIDPNEVMPAMPAGFDPCIWNALVDLAPSAEDVRIIASFESVGDGRGSLPPIPTFINRTHSPTLLGLTEDAAPTDIGPRYVQLSTLLRQAEVAAGDDFYVPEAQLDARRAVDIRDATRELLDGLRAIN